jgi:divalent metal cation (Fe/Co/Zn/Cd) transporter
MSNDAIGIALGVILGATGLLIHIASYTKAIEPQRKKIQLRYIAIALIIVGGTMAMYPFMLHSVQR